MNILQFDTEQSWVTGVATFWRDRLRARPSLKQCVASGNTPIPVYRELVRAVRQGQVSFKDSVIYALDEFGGLALDDPGKCRHMLVRDLVGQIDLPESSFHFFDPDAADLDAECQAYDRAAGKGFDVVILGIGLNGHLGMNEPGSSPDSPTRRIQLHPTTISSSARYLSHSHLPQWGLTVGMKQFFDSAEVWLVATGSAKAEIVRRVVKGEITTDVPATLMRRHANCSLFVDAAAGALL